jgi:hypothetical protein
MIPVAALILPALIAVLWVETVQRGCGHNQGCTQGNRGNVLAKIEWQSLSPLVRARGRREETVAEFSRGRPAILDTATTSHGRYAVRFR